MRSLCISSRSRPSGTEVETKAQELAKEVNRLPRSRSLTSRNGTPVPRAASGSRPAWACARLLPLEPLPHAAVSRVHMHTSTFAAEVQPLVYSFVLNICLLIRTLLFLLSVHMPIIDDMTLYFGNSSKTSSPDSVIRVLTRNIHTGNCVKIDGSLYHVGKQIWSLMTCQPSLPTGLYISHSRSISGLLGHNSMQGERHVEYSLRMPSPIGYQIPVL